MDSIKNSPEGDGQVLIPDKFLPNLQSVNIVRRDGLLKDLNAATEKKLTLLLAPAGSGKTTLLNQWYSEYSIDNKIAWLELDQHDDNAIRFFSYLVASLRKCLPNTDICLFNKIIDEYEYSITDQCEVIIQSLNAVGDKIYIVIDEFQYLKDKNLLEGFNYFIKYLPKNVRLVVASKVEPDIMISQLILKDEISIFNHDALKFNADDIAAMYLAMYGTKCDEAVTSTLEDNTEGWIAGIKLALLSGKYADKDTLSDIHIADWLQSDLVNYFASAVIDNLASEQKQVLVKSSLLDWFSPASLNYILKIENGAEVLQNLIQSQLFVVPIDPNGKRFRFHGLFRCALQEYLHVNYSGEVNKIHRRAVEWMLKNGFWDDAMYHATQCKAQKISYRTFKICCAEWLRVGNFDSLIRWSKEFSDEIILQELSISACLICSYAFTRKFNQAEFYFKELVSHIQDKHSDKAHQIKSLHSILDMLQKNMKDYNDDTGDYSDESTVSRGLNAFKLVISAYYSLQSGETHRARTDAEKAKHQLELLNQTYLKGYAELVLILVDRLEGNSIQAMIRAEANYQASKSLVKNPIWLNASTALAVVRYEQNNLVEAKSMLLEIVPMLSTAGATEIVASCYSILARIHSIQGNYKESIRILNYLQSVLEIGHYDYFVSAAYQETILTAFNNGRTDIINYMFDKIKGRLSFSGNALPTPDTYNLSWDRYSLSVAYYWYSKDDYHHALRICSTIASAAEKSGILSRYAIANGFAAMCLYKLSQKDRSFDLLRSTIDKAGVECLNRSFFDEAPGVNNLFNEFVSDTEFVLPQLFVDMFSSLIRDDEEEQGLNEIVKIDELTEKENRLLRLLCEGYSNKEISAMSNITLSTTKWHFKNIYQKLNVRNRTEAVILAERLDILRKL